MLKQTFKGYVVVFRNMIPGSPYRGVMTWTSFPNKAKFKEAIKSSEYKGMEAVEHGITPERAIELTKETPVECYLNVAVAEAVDPDTGVVDENRLMRRISIAMFAIGRSHKKSLLRLPR